MHHYTSATFGGMIEQIHRDFKVYSEVVRTEKWQGMDITKRPEMESRELTNYFIKVDTGGMRYASDYASRLGPNLPWADDHFLERVSGVPLNPGVQWRNWPWASSADKHRTEGEMFNHTYMERLWPRHAGRYGPLTDDNPQEFYERLNSYTRENPGIRGQLGELSTLVDMLAWEPYTRQAYIPLYFPEDTGLQGRKPCTLGYQFLRRGNRLHIYYPLRSCDFIRHFRDDVYLALRLGLWMIEECTKCNEKDWRDVTLGDYAMHITSFHIFKNDYSIVGITP